MVTLSPRGSPPTSSVAISRRNRRGGASGKGGWGGGADSSAGARETARGVGRHWAFSRLGVAWRLGLAGGGAGGPPVLRYRIRGFRVLQGRLLGDRAGPVGVSGGGDGRPAFAAAYPTSGLGIMSESSRIPNRTGQSPRSCCAYMRLLTRAAGAHLRPI